MPEIAPPHHARRPVARALAAAALLAAAICPAQTRRGPAPQPPENVTRAVAVYEWVGDLNKPTAVRVIPVSLFLDQHFEDAALYLSRPVPLALQTGTVYELQSAGVNRGTLTLQTATHLHSLNVANAFDNGWFGSGSFKPLPQPATTALNTAPSNAHIVTEGRPHFSKQPDTPATTPPTAATPADKPAATAGTAPPPDPDRPTLHHTAPGDPQATPSTQPPASTQTTTPPQPSTTQTANTPPPATSAPASDPDRPTLHRAPPEAKKKKTTSDSASVTEAGGLLADDPNRPRLHHGPPTGAGPSLPPLKGLPADLHQLVGVSDATDRPEHDFTYTWPNAAQKAAILAKLEAMARAALPAPTAPPPAKPLPRTAARTRKPVPPPPLTLLNEELHAYEISYGGADVFVFTAHTAGEGAELHYVTLLAQPDIYGELHLLLQSVTDAAHLDQSPRMRFVDAVDADADNRAELLFELRGQTQRQFALYRIAQGVAVQAFLAGTTQ